MPHDKHPQDSSRQAAAVSRPRCCNYTENTKRNVLTKPLFVGKINILITLDQQGD